MIDEEKSRPKYPISVVAEMIGVHPQTLRLYEREGLVKPQRTNRQTRLYSENDIERLKSIINLTQEMGVNLAGVELILRMRAQIDEMQTTVEELMQKLYQKIQQKFTENDYHEMAGIVPRAASPLQAVRQVEPQNVEGEIQDKDQKKQAKNKSGRG
jgi:MerR family transcriptional regulator, heat shock protein HspR